MAELAHMGDGSTANRLGSSGGNKNIPPVQTVFPAPGAGARRGRAAAAGAPGCPGSVPPGCAGAACAEGRCVPWGKLACDSLRPLGLSMSVPHVPAHVLLFYFFFFPSGIQVPKCPGSWPLGRAALISHPEKVTKHGLCLMSRGRALGAWGQAVLQLQDLGEGCKQLPLRSCTVSPFAFQRQVNGASCPSYGTL